MDSILKHAMLIYMNHLSHAIKYCKVHHFADDTNLLHFKSATKMKHLSVGLNATKIYLNVQNTESAIFKQKRNII